jgi:hypothetical protein
MNAQILNSNVPEVDPCETILCSIRRGKGARNTIRGLFIDKVAMKPTVASKGKAKIAEFTEK